MQERKQGEKEQKKKKSVKEERIRQIALSYYSRKDIQKVMFEFSKNRECIARYFEGFGKRPDYFNYESDIPQLVRKGATSFHCSEELWEDVLQISTGLASEELSDLRVGWDLIIDIDSKYLDYSKITTELLIEALKFHNLENTKVKFSGNKGFHIIIPWQAFPQLVNEIETRKMFPEWARIILLYLKQMIETELIKRITAMTEKRSYVKDFQASKEVVPDIILVSSRHLFRMPYSLHEKTSLVSCVIDKSKIQDFKPSDAHPFKISVRDFMPQAKKNEAKELLLQALDWYKQVQKEKKSEKQRKQYEQVVIKNLTSELFPPCVKLILKGMKDGKKRALFILMNFFKSLGLSQQEIEEKVEEWNKKNKPLLREGYIKSQLSWQARQKTMMPPNCDKEFYKGVGVCTPDDICSQIKNPVNYVMRKLGTGRKRPNTKTYKSNFSKKIRSDF